MSDKYIKCTFVVFLATVIFNFNLACRNNTKLSKEKASTISRNLLASAKSLDESLIIKYDVGTSLQYADKLKGLCSNLYFPLLTPENQEWVLNKFKHLTSFGSFVTIYSGYSKSGLHFIVIKQSTMRHDFDFDDAANYFRVDNNESNFLSKLYFMNQFVLDIFAEDLSGVKGNITNFDLKIYGYDGIERYKVQLNDLKPEIIHFIKENNRKIWNKNNLSLNDWHLIPLKESESWPEMHIILNDEELLLKQIGDIEKCPLT